MGREDDGGIMNPKAIRARHNNALFSSNPANLVLSNDDIPALLAWVEEAAKLLGGRRFDRCTCGDEDCWEYRVTKLLAGLEDGEMENKGD